MSALHETTPPTGLVPDQLLSNIRRGDCVLFFGADLPLGYPGAPPSRPELAAALARAYDLPVGRPWPETAQAYVTKYQNDYATLISFVAERCSPPRAKVGPPHRAIARIVRSGFRAIVTSWYDELLETALREVGLRVNRVVGDSQLPFARTGEQEVILFKLFGCLSNPKSLVLTTAQHRREVVHLGQKLKLVTALCAIRPLLILGHDLTDATLAHLYDLASEGIVDYMPRSYAVWPAPTEKMRGAWQGMNLELVDQPPPRFCQALAKRLTAIAESTPRRRVSRPPYKFLEYYRTEDAEIFHGRTTESQVLFRMVFGHRLLTLFGPSGAGKTSLLLAGVVPRLAAEEYQHVYVRVFGEPLLAVREAIAERVGGLAEDYSGDLRAFLEATLAPTDRLVIIVDQFEELFLRVGSEARLAFFRELAAAMDQPKREVRFIICLREDYLARLDEARPYLPDIFANSYRLTMLDSGGARIAITEPALLSGVIVEPSLVDTLVGASTGAGIAQGGDLAEVDVEGTGRHVPPAAVQIVMERLYRAALPPNHPADAAPPAGLTLTLEAYRTIRYRPEKSETGEELYGARAILAGYVREGLAQLPELKEDDEKTPMGADAACGEAILKALVTSQGTKAALTYEELLGALIDERCVADDQAGRDRVQNTCRGLRRVRLLRDFTRGGVAYYELAHDYMAQEISGWLEKSDLQVRLAREFLSREVDNWRHARLLMPPDGFKFVDQHRERLRNLLPDELELLLRSALKHGDEVAYWFDRIRAGAPEMLERLLADAVVSDALVDALIDRVATADDATCEGLVRLVLETKARDATAAVRDILVCGSLQPYLSARCNPATGELEGEIVSGEGENRAASWLVRLGNRLHDRLPGLAAERPLATMIGLRLEGEDPWVRLFASLALFDWADLFGRRTPRDFSPGEAVDHWQAGLAAVLRESMVAELTGRA